MIDGVGLLWERGSNTSATLSLPADQRFGFQGIKIEVRRL